MSNKPTTGSGNNSGPKSIPSTKNDGTGTRKPGVTVTPPTTKK